MKTTLNYFLGFFFLVLTSTTLFASHPVAKKSTTATEVSVSTDDAEPATISDAFTKIMSSGKSQIVALVLVLVAGGLGVHRFYLGYIGIGVAQVLTLGGCGIWSLIDCIRIVTGDLGPKDGRYTKTL